ncbi:hypothetical protein DBR45_03990 [Pseudomonas sp. HMWF031]|nr:hypothetical protein DBR45_03990 [Pseudomonas sp. HMWF031]
MAGGRADKMVGASQLPGAMVEAFSNVKAPVGSLFWRPFHIIRRIGIFELDTYCIRLGIL